MDETTGSEVVIYWVILETACSGHDLEAAEGDGNTWKGDFHPDHPGGRYRSSGYIQRMFHKAGSTIGDHDDMRPDFRGFNLGTRLMGVTGGISFSLGA